MQWAFGAPMNLPRFFESQYHCSSTALAGKDVDEGDKIFLPPSALDRLARLDVQYPLLFEVTNNVVGKKTHCGVLEFSAEEGWCYMPFWMMQNLLIEEQSVITVKNVSLSKASFVKFRAQSVDFLEVSNPRALLEVSLRKFTCLTVGDTICIPYSNTKFYLDVREVQPNGAASIIETDCNVDFEEPLGYQDSKYAESERKFRESQSSRSSSFDQTNSVPRTLQKAKNTSEEDEKNANSFNAFGGKAKRIDGKTPQSVIQAKTEAPMEEPVKEEKKTDPGEPKVEPPVPAYKSKIGDKYSKKKTAVSAFTGAARKLG